VPIVLGNPRVPYEKIQRLRSIASPAPENASEAVNGLGEFQNMAEYAQWMQRNRRPMLTHGGYKRTALPRMMPTVPVKTAMYQRPMHSPPIIAAPTVYAPHGYNKGYNRGYNRMRRGWMAFNGLGADTLATSPVQQPAAQTSIWSTINQSLSQPAVGTLLQTGTNFYVQQQTNKDQAALLATQAQTAALQAQLAQQRAAAAAAAGQKPGMPGWVIPVAAVGVVGLGAFLFLRK